MILVIGPPGCGKSTAIAQLAMHEFPSRTIPKIAAANAYVDQCSVRLVKTAAAWSGHGVDLGADHDLPLRGVVVLFDVTAPGTFCAQTLGSWVADARDRHLPCILAATKMDLLDVDPTRARVPFKDAVDLATACGVMYIETSAAHHASIRMAFSLLVKDFTSGSELADPHGHVHSSSDVHSSSHIRPRPQAASQKGCAVS